MVQDREILHSAAARMKEALIRASRVLPDDAYRLISEAVPAGGKAAAVMEAIRRNLMIAQERSIPMCQDTGAFWCLVSIGRDSGADMVSVERAVNEGAAAAAEEGFFRRSIVSDPAGARVNTGTNLPVFISYELADGSDVRIDFLLKGFGSENCSSVTMLNPTAGEDGVVEAVLDIVRAGGGKPCPPVFLGIGIGGTMDRAAFLSKKAFFRDDADPALSSRILEAVNALGIGPGGLGGSPTALGAYIQEEPTHIAGLPVAVTVNCWAERKASIVFRKGEI